MVETGSSARLRRWPLLMLAVLVGLNLRPFLTAAGPLAASIRSDTGMALQDMALLTLVPMGLMGVLAFAGPSVQTMLGARRAMTLALTVMAIGSFGRFLAATSGALILTAALLGIGVAIVQAVFPGVLKRHFAGHLTVVMGLYSATLMGGGALGARLSPWIADRAGSWHGGLGGRAGPAAVAAVAAAMALPRGERAGAADAAPPLAMLRRPRTWLLMICFGLVNGGYHRSSPGLHHSGWSAPASGGLLAVMALSQGIAALAFPVLARRGRDRRGWLWLTLALQATGFAGLAIAPDLAPSLWAISVGAGLGANFALTMVVAPDHFEDPAAAGALAALMQEGGFLLAAVAPWIVTLLHDETGHFTAGWGDTPRQCRDRYGLDDTIVTQILYAS